MYPFKLILTDLFPFAINMHAYLVWHLPKWMQGYIKGISVYI